MSGKAILRRQSRKMDCGASCKVAALAYLELPVVQGRFEPAEMRLFAHPDLQCLCQFLQAAPVFEGEQFGMRFGPTEGHARGHKLVCGTCGDAVRFFEEWDQRFLKVADRLGNSAPRLPLSPIAQPGFVPNGQEECRSRAKDTAPKADPFAPGETGRESQRTEFGQLFDHFSNLPETRLIEQAA